jgi:L-alanine-DL-glutamate epimerase-like enolase superfamily enzyme
VTLVCITADDGTQGWGEAISQFPEASLATKVLVDRGFAPLLLGEDAGNTQGLFQRMTRHAYWYGSEGIAAFAISAIDMALWDLKGKALGVPVWSLLGGRTRDAIPAMASVIFDMDDLDWTLSEFEGFREAGYLITKAGWGMRPEAVFGQDAAKDLRYVSAVREVIGDGIALVVDVPGASGIWDVPTAIRRCRQLEPFDLRWIEQPLPPGDLEGYRRLREAVCTPIGAGEDEWGPESYQHVLRAGAVDVLQFDPGRCLGITGSRTVLSMAEAAGTTCTAHSWSSALNTAASLHLLASSPVGDTLDFKPHASPMQHELVTDPWEVVDGLIELRDLPGLGVEVDPDVVAAYSFT